MSSEIKKVSCRLCTYCCPLEAHVTNGDVVKVGSDPMAPDGRAFLCERAALGAIDFHNHPQRLNYPLKRAGERGENRWEKISWNQALDEIAERLAPIKEKYGAEALASLGVLCASAAKLTTLI